MKVKLHIELELPEECEHLLKDELTELLYEYYVDFVTKAHHKKAITWFKKAHRPTTQEAMESASLVHRVHKTWFQICKTAKLSIER